MPGLGGRSVLAKPSVGNLSVAVVTSGTDDTDMPSGAPYSTSAFGMTAGKLYIAVAQSRRTSGDLGSLTFTQTGATWTSVRSQVWVSSDIPMQVRRCQPTSDVASVVMQIKEATVSLVWCEWIILEVTGAFNDSANNGAAAIIESVDIGANPSNSNSATPTLASAVNAPDGILGFFTNNAAGRPSSSRSPRRKPRTSWPSTRRVTVVRPQRRRGRPRRAGRPSP